MALSTELKKRLHSEDEPLPKRLKLAHNAFCAIDLPIFKKEDIILEWLSKMCSEEQSGWKFLQLCLKSNNINMQLDTRRLLIDVCLQKLNEKGTTLLIEVLDCCNLLLLNSSMQHYFNSKPKDLGSLLRSFMIHVNKFLRNTDEYSSKTDTNLLKVDDDMITLAYNTTVNIMESFIQIYKQSINTKEELRMIFLHDILYPLCAIINQSGIDCTNRVGAVTYKCLQQLIFWKNKYVQNKVHEEVLKELFLVLGNHTEIITPHDNLTTFVFIFRAAIGSYKSNSIILDQIFRGLIVSSGIYKKEILVSLLKEINDITFTFDNNIDGISLYNFFQDIVDNILQNENLVSVDCKVLTEILYFNPALVDKKMQRILNKIYIQEETAENTALMIAILDASIRLKREQILIEELLIALKKSLVMARTFAENHIFPPAFKTKLIASISSITSSQGSAILKTLISYLNTDCVELLQSNASCKNITIMKGTVELLVTFLEGICIFENKYALSHQTFVTTFNELKNILSTLICKVLQLNYDKSIMTILLTATLSWNEVYNMLKYYVPDIITCKKSLLIEEEQWRQLIQRVTNFGEDICKEKMNKLILQWVRYVPSNVSCMEVKNLIGGLKHTWRMILRSNVETLQLLNDREISKLTLYLLADIESNNEAFLQWSTIINKEYLQENIRFITYLLTHVFIRIGSIVTTGTTKTIFDHITKKIEKTEIIGKKVKKLLEIIREEIKRKEWRYMDDITLDKIKIYLNILLCIPLKFLDLTLRTLIFMTIYIINKECNHHKEITFLCNKIFANTLEKNGVDILHYIDSELLMQELPEYKAFSKPFEQSLLEVKSAEILEVLLNSAKSSTKSMYVLLESIGSIKLKLQVEQKPFFRKIEKKISKKIVNMLPKEIEDSCDIKYLTLVLKVAVLRKKIDDNLKQTAELTLCNIFKQSNIEPYKLQTVEEGSKLAVVILQNHKKFDISDTTISEIWLQMLKFPYQELLLPLLTSTKPAEFQELLHHLHLQMMESLLKKDNNYLDNVCIIWTSISKSAMSTKRNKLRLTAIDKLFESVLSTHICEEYWSKLLKLFQNILSAKCLYVSNYIIDASLIATLKSLEKVTIVQCSDALLLCDILIKVRTSFIIDRLPTLLLVYRRIIKLIVISSKTVKDKCDEHVYQCLILDIEKFTNYLIKLKKDMKHTSSYIIADLIKLLSEGDIMPSIKVTLENIIGLLSSTCNQHEIALLSRTLPVSMQEIFKRHHNTFKRYHKFSGKI